MPAQDAWPALPLLSDEAMEAVRLRPPPASSRHAPRSADAERMMPMDILFFYAGMLAMLVGLVCLVRPFAVVGIRTRPAAGLVLAGGAVSAFLAVYGTGARLIRADGRSMKIDELMPEYHFHEVHSIRVHAPAARTYDAILAVSPGEIRFFKTLMAIRTLPARLLGADRPRPLVAGYVLRSRSQQDPATHAFSTDFDRGTVTVARGAKASLVYEVGDGAKPSTAGEIIRAYVGALQKIGGLVVAESGRGATLRLGAQGGGTGSWIALDADEDGRRYRLTVVQPGEFNPLLDFLTSSGFLRLAEERESEVVVGTLNRYGRSSGTSDPRTIATPGEFLAFSGAGYVKIACNFHVEEEDPGWSSVRTETRVLATDATAWRAFALYWHVIYPGSATIRREWLRAIKRRAEAPPRFEQPG
jgi:hypothetical protein